jgi:predicted ATPase
MDALIPMLRAADLGIEDVTFVDEQMPPEAAELVGHIIEMMRRKSPGEEIPEPPSSLQVVRFIHRGGATFKPDQESNGTLSFFALLGPGLRTLREGGTLCVDELDTSLHPSLAIQLVRLFQNPESNPKRAQLIFNTHDTNLLNHAGLRRDQIWFCEKARDGATTLYPLSDFKARLGENLATGYLQGRYGAIPFLNEQVFEEVMALQNGKE